MFRANRIGTPWIHNDDAQTSTADWTPTTVSNILNINGGNVINAAPVTDFGRNALSWAGSEVFAANLKWVLGQQFNISEPLEGNTVGVELMGSLALQAPASATLLPVFFEVTAAGGFTFAPVTRANAVTPVGAPQLGVIGTHTLVERVHSYRDQLIYKGTENAVAGTFYHGLCVIDNGSAGYTMTALQAQFAVRQLVDQPDTGYRDTRR